MRCHVNSKDILGSRYPSWLSKWEYFSCDSVSLYVVTNSSGNPMGIFLKGVNYLDILVKLPGV